MDNVIVVVVYTYLTSLYLFALFLLLLLQKMQELLSEQEDIKKAYEEQEAEYMLVVAELSAARDRIARLLTHLEKYVYAHLVIV